MTTRKIEMQDNKGNIYYPVTDASIVKNGNTTVENQLNNITNQLNNITNTKLGKTENAVSATRLNTARNIAISGGATGTATSFDGSKDIAISVTALDASKLTGTASKLQVGSSIATGNYSVAIGNDSKSKSNNTVAIGSACEANGYDSFAQGGLNIANGTRGFATGYSTEARASNTFTMGQYTIGNYSCEVVMGTCNKDKKLNANYNTMGDLLTIGYGTPTARANCFRVTGYAVYGNGAYNTSGADYAEYFEWLDGNVNNEDRVALFVTLDAEKIRIANEDDYILGIVSTNASIIGNSEDDNWHGMYLYDEYERPIYEEIVMDAQYEIIPPIYDKNGNVIEEEKTIEIIPQHTELRQKLNPNYDNTKEYIPRSERHEWDTVGMLGQLIVKDDGTCEVNGYCKQSNNGIATKSDNGYRVIKRINENLIKIIFK